MPRRYTYRHRHHARPFAHTIRTGYHGLSLLNTVSVLLTFNPVRILAHILRRTALRRVSNILH